MDIKKLTLAVMDVQQKRFITPIMVIQKIIQIRTNTLLNGIRAAILYLKEDKKRGLFMKYDNNFNNVHDLVDCLNRGCEVEFLYNNKKYSITHIDEGISVMEFYNEDSEKTYSDAKKVLEYEIDGKLLKDIIPEMKIIDRSF